MQFFSGLEARNLRMGKQQALLLNIIVNVFFDVYTYIYIYVVLHIYIYIISYCTGFVQDTAIDRGVILGPSSLMRSCTPGTVLSYLQTESPTPPLSYGQQLALMQCRVLPTMLFSFSK